MSLCWGLTRGGVGVHTGSKRNQESSEHLNKSPWLPSCWRTGTEIPLLSPLHRHQLNSWAAQGLKWSLGSWEPFTETLVNITQRAPLSRGTFIIWMRLPAWSWEICLSFSALQRGEELAGTGIGLNYLAVPLLLSAVDRTFRISCLMGLFPISWPFTVLILKGKTNRRCHR